MKRIAKKEEELNEVLDNLTQDEKLIRLKGLYSGDEVLEILGYYDDSIDKEDCDFINSYKGGLYEAGYLLGIENGNFELAIAMNKHLVV